MRKIINQKENERKLFIQQEKYAEAQRALMKKEQMQFMKQGFGEAEDMQIAYDMNGKAMRIKQINFDQIQENQNKPQSVINVNYSQPCERQQNSAIQALKEFLERKRENQLKQTGSDFNKSHSVSFKHSGKGEHHSHVPSDPFEQKNVDA